MKTPKLNKETEDRFNEKVGQHYDHIIDRDGYDYDVLFLSPEELKQFLAQEITRAREEERRKMVGMIDEPYFKLRLT